jgi:hypothetical protein
MQLLERGQPLASLAEYARQARHGDGRLVLVTGEAGVGKSALVERLESDLNDARWSWGACDGLVTPRPLGPLFDLAAQLGGELLGLCRARAPRSELFDALLRQASEPGTLNVVIVEDVHWADEATVDLLRFLGPPREGRPVRRAPDRAVPQRRRPGLLPARRAGRAGHPRPSRRARGALRGRPPGGQPLGSPGDQR